MIDENVLNSIPSLTKIQKISAKEILQQRNNPLDKDFTIAHWYRGGQKVVPQNLQAKSNTK